MSVTSALPPLAASEPLKVRLRRVATAKAVDQAFLNLARLGRLVPRLRPERHGVETVADVPYGPTGRPEHTLDVYRPAGGGAGRPVVLYVHGGGFRALSKDTHWLMALAFARRGYVVFNVNYRLAPRHRFPTPLEDVCEALLFVHRHAERYGGDPGRLVLAGESAGANLVTALAVASCWRRPEPYARAVFDAGVSPRAVIPACGLLQVSDPDRFARSRPLPAFLLDQIRTCAIDYLPGGGAAPGAALADPLCVIEGAAPPERALPPFFVPVGTRDPLVDDTVRLHAAIARLGGRSTARFYPDELHAFHALIWRPGARDCWRDTFAFLSGVDGLQG